MFTADNWCVKVDDRIYGPYSSMQLRKYAQQGRFAAWSQIAPAGSREWREAGEEPAFASLFGMAPRATGRRTLAFGKRDAGPQEENSAPPQTEKIVNACVDGLRGHASQAGCVEAGVANFIIVFDVVNAAASRIETAVLSLGSGFRIAENVWAVSCELTAIGVRNALAPYLLPRESIFVVDATRGRTSWQNYAPETHAKLATAWSAAR